VYRALAYVAVVVAAGVAAPSWPLEGLWTPEALNDLAWTLQAKGEFPEAETHVQRALRMNDRLLAAWDTLGVIYMRTGRLTDAEHALGKALPLAATDLVVHLHMAEMHALRGHPEEAGRHLYAVRQRRGELTAQQKLDHARIRQMMAP